MDYPTLATVELATHMELGAMLRHLPSPGMNIIDRTEDLLLRETTREQEAAVMERIRERFNAFGGWNSTISKAIGWDKR